MVTVDAGVLTADLLDFLAGYGTGWCLADFPWFTFASIGGQARERASARAHTLSTAFKTHRFLPRG